MNSAVQQEFAAALERLWNEHNTSLEGGTQIEGEYLEVIATR